MSDLFRGSGGYRWLDSYVMGTIIQLGTHRFCEKFLTRQIDPTGRQYDQMTQAARSGCMNNVEGSERGATSKETEMRLRMSRGQAWRNWAVTTCFGCSEKGRRRGPNCRTKLAQFTMSGWTSRNTGRMSCMILAPIF